MNSTEFCYWLQGYFEIAGKDVTLSTDQAKIVQEHLKLVFDKQTPPSPFDITVPEVLGQPKSYYQPSMFDDDMNRLVINEAIQSAPNDAPVSKATCSNTVEDMKAHRNWCLANIPFAS